MHYDIDGLNEIYEKLVNYDNQIFEDIINEGTDNFLKWAKIDKYGNPNKTIQFKSDIIRLLIKKEEYELCKLIQKNI